MHYNTGNSFDVDESIEKIWRVIVCPPLPEVVSKHLTIFCSF